METDNQSPEEAARISEQLVSRDLREREAAERALREMGPGAVEILLNLMERERAGRKRFRRNLLCVCLPVLPLLIFLLHTTGILHAGWGMVVAFLALPYLLSLPLTPLEQNITRLLAEHSDISTIGALLDALDVADAATEALIAETLSRLLPRMRASDSGRLTDHQRIGLMQTIHTPKAWIGSDYVITVLKALEQIGTEKELPLVERIANGETRFPNRVYLVARECLPYLRERARQAQESSRLLRPASPPNDAAAMLLRPARGGSEAHPERLLRPVGDGEGGSPYDGE
jgi:hypothetical protein